MDTLPVIKKKPGRPTEAKRTEQITVPLSPDEKDAVLAAAMLADKRPAAWARSVLVAATRKEETQ
jgi:hypothetical protein